MGSRQIEHANYMRRLYEKKLDKADPEQSFEGRVREALSAMDEEFGPKWRKIMDDSGLDVMPASESAEEVPHAEHSLLEALQNAADEEGIGEPPCDIDEKKHQRPTIFVIMREKLFGKSSK